MVGVGLIGGSFARALREAGVVGSVVGIGRSMANLEQALALGIVDEVSQNTAEGVAGADMVFVSVPVCSVIPTIRQMAGGLGRGCVVTDGGSVKAEIVSQCEALMPEGCHFVGGHPIAGTEHSGAAASFATLYQGRRCIITPTVRTDQDALDKVTQAWCLTGPDARTQWLLGLYRTSALLSAAEELGDPVDQSLGRLLGRLRLIAIAAPSDLTADIDTPQDAARHRT